MIAQQAIAHAHSDYVDAFQTLDAHTIVRFFDVSPVLTSPHGVVVMASDVGVQTQLKRGHTHGGRR